MSPGTALRQLQQAQAGLKKARQLLKNARGEGQARPGVLRAGWESLAAGEPSDGRDPGGGRRRSRDDPAARRPAVCDRPAGPAAGCSATT